MNQTVLSKTTLAAIWLAMGMVVSIGAQAQPREPSPLQVSIWASSCMACHGPEGRAEGTGLTIGGRPADDLLGKLMGYKSGQLQATIMHQHTRGYSDGELRLIANYFSSLK